jgi:hypothetical protein
VLTGLTGVGQWNRGLVFRCVLGSEGCVLVPRSSCTPVATWAWPTWVVSQRHVLGNSGKPVTLETLSLTKFLRHVFQGQETHDFRKPGTYEASDSRMRKIPKLWFSEEVVSRTCGSPEPRSGDGANFGRWPIRESVEDPVWESRAKTFTNQRRSESRSRESVGDEFGSHT